MVVDGVLRQCYLQVLLPVAVCYWVCVCARASGSPRHRDGVDVRAPVRLDEVFSTRGLVSVGKRADLCVVDGRLRALLVPVDVPTSSATSRLLSVTFNDNPQNCAS